MHYHLAIKKNEDSPFVREWMDLEIIQLSKISQGSVKYVSHIYSDMWNIEKDMA